MREKKWTYHRSHSFIEDGREVTAITQLYKVGVYMIVNNDPSLQFSLEPKDIVLIEKELLQKVKKGKISDLLFGREVIVTKVEGLLEELKT